MRFGPAFRFLVAASCALAVASALAQGDVKVTYETKAAFVPKVLAQISRLVGVNLEVSKPLADELLIISVKDVALPELMEKIAWAVHGEWQKEKQGLRLVRSAGLMQKLRQEDLARKSEGFRKAQQGIRDQLARDGAFDDASLQKLTGDFEVHVREARANFPRLAGTFRQRQQAFVARTPVGRLVSSIAIALDPGVLASLAPEGRMVFSSRSNRMQRPLPKVVDAAFRAFQADQAKWAQATSAIVREDTNYEEYHIVDSSVQGHQTQRDIDPTPDKVLVAVRRYGMDSGIHIDVKVVNAQGHYIVRTSTTLRSDSLSIEPPSLKAEAGDPTEPNLTLSETSQKLAEALRPLMGQAFDSSKSLNLPPEIRQVLLNPESRDLAEFTASELLLGIAKARGVNLVAVSGDFFGFMSLYGATQGPLKPAVVLRQLGGRQFGLETGASSGWMTFRPNDFIGLLDRHVDSRALGKLLRASVAAVSVPLEALAEFVAAQKTRFTESMVPGYLMFLIPNALDSIDYGNDDFLRLHGLLKLGQKDAMISGGKIRFADLLPDQQAQLAKVVYSRENYFQYRPSPGKNRDPERTRLVYEGVLGEPTEAFPDGIPPGAILSLTLSEKEVMRTSGTSQYGRTSSTRDVTEIAYERMGLERPDVFGSRGDQTNWEKYRWTIQREYRYELAMTPELYKSGQLKDVQQSGEWVDSYDKLPESFRKSVESELAKLREQFKNVKPPPR